MCFKSYIFSSALFCELNKTTIAQLTMDYTEELYLTLIFLDMAASGHRWEYSESKILFLSN